MATTQMLSSNPNAVKVWEKKVWLQAMQQSVIGHMFNRGSVYFPSEFLGRAARGDEATLSYVGKLTGVPVGEGGVLVNNAEALDLDSMTLAMNVCRIGSQSPSANTIEQQRTHIDFYNTMRDRIAKRAVELLDASAFYQLAGAAPTTLSIDGTNYISTNIKFVQGLNSIIAPTSDRIVRAGAVSNDQSLGASSTMTLDLIDYALESLATSSQPVEMLDGMTFDLYVSPEQLVDLQHDSSGKIQWFNIELAKITGSKSNTIEDRFQNGMVCAGKYRNVYIYAAPRVAYGVSSADSSVITTVRRAVLVGRDALSFASPFGGRVTDTSTPIKFFEEEYDVGYQTIVEGRMIYGLKKMSPSAKQDLGVCVISTYAASHG